jgi:hypothetical protein
MKPKATVGLHLVLAASFSGSVMKKHLASARPDNEIIATGRDGSKRSPGEVSLPGLEELEE